MSRINAPGKPPKIKRVSFRLSDNHHALLRRLIPRESEKHGRRVTQSEILAWALELFKRTGHKFKWPNYSKLMQTSDN